MTFERSGKKSLEKRHKRHYLECLNLLNIKSVRSGCISNIKTLQAIYADSSLICNVDQEANLELRAVTCSKGVVFFHLEDLGKPLHCFGNGTKSISVIRST